MVVICAKEALRDSGYLNQATIMEKCGLILGNLSFQPAPLTSCFHLFIPKL